MRCVRTNVPKRQSALRCVRTNVRKRQSAGPKLKIWLYVNVDVTECKMRSPITHALYACFMSMHHLLHLPEHMWRWSAACRHYLLIMCTRGHFSWHTRFAFRLLHQALVPGMVVWQLVDMLHEQLDGFGNSDRRYR